MQNGLRSKADQLENLIAIQKDCIPKNYEYGSDYMVGLHNGLVLAHSIYIPGSPNYISTPVKLKTKIRHKSKK